MKKMLFLFLLIFNTLFSGEKEEKLKKDIGNLKNGGYLYIESGTYHDLGLININSDRVNISGKMGEVILSGEVTIRVRGNNSTISNLIFRSGKPSISEGAVVLEGSYNTLHNSVIEDFSNYEYVTDKNGEYFPYNYITLKGKNLTVSNSLFTGKNKRGNLLEIVNTDLLTPDNHKILLNEFRDLSREKSLQGKNSNSWSVIRVGTGATSSIDSYTEISDNLFSNIDGEGEIISVKNNYVTISGNYIMNSKGMISLRQSDNSRVTDNLILGSNKEDSGGIRFYGDNHYIANNYIENVSGWHGDLSGIAILNGSDSIKDKKGDKSVEFQSPGSNTIIENNTIVNSGRNILFSEEKILSEEGDITKYPSNITLRNNLSYNDEKNGYAIKGMVVNSDKSSNVTFDRNAFIGNISVFENTSGIERVTDTYRIESFLFSKEKDIGARKFLLFVEGEEEFGPKY